LAYEIVNYKLYHFIKRENYELRYGGRITYDKKYIVNKIISYRPPNGMKKENVICPVCKKIINIRIASEERSIIFNRIYKMLSFMVFCSTIFLTIESSFSNWLLIIPFGGLFTLLLFTQDYRNPKILKDFEMNFIGHKILDRDEL
jgi:hypothetical protein